MVVWWRRACSQGGFETRPYEVVAVLPRPRSPNHGFRFSPERRRDGVGTGSEWFGVSVCPAHPNGRPHPNAPTWWLRLLCGVINTPHPSTHRGHPVPTGRGTGAHKRRPYAVPAGAGPGNPTPGRVSNPPLRGGCSCCAGVINTPHPSTHRGHPVPTGRGTGAGRPPRSPNHGYRRSPARRREGVGTGSVWFGVSVFLAPLSPDHGSPIGVGDDGGGGWVWRLLWAGSRYVRGLALPPTMGSGFHRKDEGRVWAPDRSGLV